MLLSGTNSMLTSIEQASANSRPEPTIQCKEAFVLHNVDTCFQLQADMPEIIIRNPTMATGNNDISAMVAAYQARRLCAVCHSDSLQLHPDLCYVCNIHREVGF